ncbi:luciferin sulfotransferase-like [Chironomus tepperi]|uniref:luciferin sulfotransferase-like n=1 Tax=Chironomus tepperi TaxID=113505 RepID=UPI00391F32AB
MHRRLITLNSNNFEKRFQQVSSKKQPFMIVKSTDEKWKNFPETYFYPEFNFFIHDYKDFEVREDDIFVVGFQRSGTTRTQEMAWLIANDCDFETALKHDSEVRCPNFEEVKDVAISNYHFKNLIDVKYNLDINEYFDCFLNDTILFGPYRESVQNYLNLPNYENIIYITYETMCADLEGTILMIAKFLGKSVSSENLQKLKEHLSFENMKTNMATNNKKTIGNFQKFIDGKEGDSDNFIRKGIIGDHKNSMSKEYIDRFDKWWEERSLLKQGFEHSS